MKLTKAQRGVLDEALRNGQRLSEEMQNDILDYGRWVLDHVFSGGTTAALDAKSKNPVWRELLRRAGGPTLRWLVGGPWSDLDYARTELLLPLGSGPRSATARSTSRSSGSRSGPPSSTSRRPGYLRRAAELELDAKERAEAVREIEALREALRDVATRLGRRRG